MFLRLYTTKLIYFIFIIALLELFIATTNISSSKTFIIRHYPVGAFIPSMKSRRNQQQQSSRHYSSTSSSDKRRRQEQNNNNNNAPRKNNNNEEQNPSVNHNQQQEQQTTKKKKNDDESERQQQQRREATTDAAPMYITIGPQCCGKSTFLRNLNGGKIKDISLDDQQDVYVPIATDLFLHAYDDDNNENENENYNKDKNTKELQHVYQGKSLLNRIRDNVELILILRRWNLDSTAIDFEQRILKYYKERNLSTTVAQALVVAVEDFLSTTTTTTTTTTNTKPPQMPRETDVFILESLFKPHPETRQSAIQTSYDELRKTPKHIPIAWGNTNAKAKDYERALEIAHQTRRPVKFILCHPEYSDRDDGELLTLPWVPLDELLKRNLYRLQSQGRYIPAFAIADCCQRVTAMIPPNSLATATTTTTAAASDSNPNNVQQFLVGLASPSNTVGRQQNTNNNRQRNNNQKRLGASFKYILTKHYLIQKQYPKQNNQHNYNNNNTTTTRRTNNSHNYNDEGKNSRQRQHRINGPGSTFNRNNNTNSTTRT